MKYEGNKYYHVYNRGANKQDIFRGRGDYELCLHLFGKYLSQYRVSIMAYCLMPNHYHLLLRQNEGGSISRFVQTVFNAYTQAINLSTGHSGTLFLRGRIGERPLESGGPREPREGLQGKAEAPTQVSPFPLLRPLHRELTLN